MSKKSWREKLADNKDLPKVLEMPARMKPRLGDGTLVIPAPMDRIHKRGNNYFVSDLEKAMFRFG